MFKGIFKVIAVLTLGLGGAAKADMTKLAYAEAHSVRHEPSSGRVEDGVDVMLNDHLYEVQQETSRMRFRVDSPIGDVWASFQDFEGLFTTQNAGADNDLASIEVSTQSLDTDGFIGMLLRSKHFFDVANFPSIRFVGSSLEWYRDRHAVLKGYLTIKNVTKQVAFYVVLVDADDDALAERITVEASTTIKRSAFGIRSLLPAVSDNVNLFMSIDAVKKPVSVSSR